MKKRNAEQKKMTQHRLREAHRKAERNDNTNKHTQKKKRLNARKWRKTTNRTKEGRTTNPTEKAETHAQRLGAKNKRSERERERERENGSRDETKSRRFCLSFGFVPRAKKISTRPE